MSGQQVGPIDQYSQRRRRELLDRIAELESERHSLYGALREAEDHGELEGIFDADERRTGPDGWDTENEVRWAAERLGTKGNVT